MIRLATIKLKQLFCKCKWVGITDGMRRTNLRKWCIKCLKEVPIETEKK